MNSVEMYSVLFNHGTTLLCCLDRCYLEATAGGKVMSHGMNNDSINHQYYGTMIVNTYHETMTKECPNESAFSNDNTRKAEEEEETTPTT